MSDALSPSIDPAKLAKLADVAVRVGLNLQPGQDLVVTAPMATLPFVRLVAAAAYRAGAGVVTPIFSDDDITLARYRHAPDESFDHAPGWLYRGMAEAFGSNVARLAIVGDDPMLLAGQDADRVARAGKANAAAYQPALKRITGSDINWSIVACPTLAWARQVFPDLGEDLAMARLAEAIFAASRSNGDDPLADWAAHNAGLQARQNWLNDQRFSALHFTGPGTDLTVGLADGHVWRGGASQARNGVTGNPNIPTEEVFTTPHAARVEGFVRASKPLAHQGSVIEGIAVRFEAGRIVAARATKGEAVLLNLLDSDTGARRLGEVALVPHGSPISQSGVLFYNTLFDENAACHLALGQCIPKCFADGPALTPDQIAARGGNASMIHVDWMIGSGEIDIDGLGPDGGRTPVFRRGTWVQAAA